jgi:hypothetical protein|tara:strand:- start:326 stop:547 length:222 start_codon:yes stop_codon:yes gene_type:complete
MDNDDWKIIARIQRDSNNEVIVKSGKYWKLDVVDLRWFNNGKPTKKGLRVNMEEAVLLSKALNKIVDDIDDTE